MEPNSPHNPSTAWLDERYRQIIEQVEDYAIFTLDNEGLVSSWNEGAERMLGFSEEEVLGQLSAFIFIPEEQEQGVPEREMETAQVEGRASDDHWHLRKDGSRFFGNGVLTALVDKGTPDGFAKILRDLTRQQLAEEERLQLLQDLGTLTETLEMQVMERTSQLEARNEELHQSQHRFTQAFRAGPVAAVITTLGVETFLEVNDAFIELTGYTNEDVDGKTHKELKMWPAPEDLAKLRRFGEEPFRNEEMTLRTRRGEVRTVLLSREVIDLGDDQVQLKQFYDITERKQGETQLMAALQRVMSDTAWFAQKVMEELTEVKVGDLELGPRIDLSKREREVLELLAQGKGNDAIADELGIAVQTVRNYISTLYDKLGVHSRAEAVVWARERGIG